MSNLFLKNFNLCFPKQKWTTNKPNDRSPRSTTQSTSSILIKSFNSLYDVTSDSTADDLFTSSDDSFSSADSPPDFASVFASQRFFFSSPGLSNSIIDSLPESDPLIGGGVAVPTYSPDPFTDFRRSMQEMVDSRDLIDVTEDWDYLHELLRCYLSLNPKHTHKFILGAFADLLVCLMSSAAGGHRRRRRSVSRRVL